MSREKYYVITDILLKPIDITSFSEVEVFAITKDDLPKLDFYMNKIVLYGGEYYKVVEKDLISEEKRNRMILMKMDKGYKPIHCFTKGG